MKCGDIARTRNEVRVLDGRSDGGTEELRKNEPTHICCLGAEAASVSSSGPRCSRMFNNLQECSALGRFVERTHCGGRERSGAPLRCAPGLVGRTRIGSVGKRRVGSQESG